MAHVEKYYDSVSDLVEIRVMAPCLAFVCSAEGFSANLGYLPTFVQGCAEWKNAKSVLSAHDPC